MDNQSNNKVASESNDIRLAFSLAKRAASTLQDRYPSICRTIPVRATKIARALGIKLRSIPTVKRARLEHSALGSDSSLFGKHDFTIAVNANISPEVGRYAVAHEIGHAILIAHYPHHATSWDLETREYFADLFASELLIPAHTRSLFMRRFRSISAPSELCGLASNLGLSLHSLLTFASKDNSWFINSNAVWLRLKYGPNKYTGRDCKLRVESAHFDKTRYYVPSNQGFERFCANDGWLGDLIPGEERDRVLENVTLKLTLANKQVKYKTERVAAELQAIRLNSGHHDKASYYLLLAQII